MTNATVANAVKDVDGRTLTLAYKGGKRTIYVADIVNFAPATEADLKPGAAVFVPAELESDGALTSGFAVVGANGRLSRGANRGECRRRSNVASR